MNYELLGKKIREQRKIKKLTLEQLAEMLEVSTTFIGQIERARGIPSLETLVKIANTLQVSVDYLLFDNLDSAAVNSQFISQINDLTDDLTSKEKEIVIKQIELLREYKQL